ncbi:MAG: hypothetical protein AAB455_02845 [Patescibacteria group bacterium]
MNYLDNNFQIFGRSGGSRPKWRSPWLLGLIIVLLFWLITRPSVFRVGEGVALTLARPFWSAGSGFSGWLERQWQFLSSHSALTLENQKLKQDLLAYTALELERERLVSDNLALRGLLNYATSTSEHLTMAARVLTRVNQSATGVLALDVGSAVASIPLKLGDLVLDAASATALGEIVAVESRVSKFELFSAWGRKREVLIGETRVPAEALGRGSGNFRLSLPREVKVAVGDPVMMIIGTEEYSLGRVSVVNHDPIEAFQEIFFRSPVNLELLTWVRLHGL